jgi:hypothetical protein
MSRKVWFSLLLLNNALSTAYIIYILNRMKAECHNIKINLKNVYIKVPYDSVKWLSLMVTVLNVRYK